VDTLIFREAAPGDAGRLGEVHVASWRETYSGLVPDALIESLSAEARAAMWRSVLGDPAAFGGTAVFVAERERAIIGFAACGSQRDEALAQSGFDGEFGAIYVLKSQQRAGIGKVLMRLMARRLLDAGRQGAALWVLRENVRARTFYDHLGGAVVGERVDGEAGAALNEVAYGWRDLAALVR
jgi:GNAT superfamily N-acetyltransferase